MTKELIQFFVKALNEERCKSRDPVEEVTTLLETTTGLKRGVDFNMSDIVKEVSTHSR